MDQEDAIISKREGLIYEVLIPAVWTSGIAPLAILLVSLFPFAFHRAWWELIFPILAVIYVYKWNKQIRTKLFLYNFDLSSRLTKDHTDELDKWGEKSFYLFLGSLIALTIVTTLLLLLFTAL
ncbi:MAG TPA: hypothetical protein VGH19_06405 [Verrucomicrobiae bacterium]